ncbi:MAG: hypothetical protein M1839_001350 [Geoglossum umbratile]|nr:MAG: hypothetical protein M1839_001350 [Geoglossum umbratile]
MALLMTAITLIQKVQKARDNVNGKSKTLENITKQITTLICTLSLVKEEERLQTASVGQQLQAIIEVADELKHFFDKIRAEQQRKAIRQFFHELKSGDKDDIELAKIFDRLDKARLELVLRISLAQVGLIGNLDDGFHVAFSVLQETNKNVKQILGRDLPLAVSVKEEQYQQADGTVPLDRVYRSVLPFCSHSGSTKTKLETYSYYEVPSLRVSQFIGRKAILDEIDDTFKETTSIPTVIVLLGMGGQGKTQIALEYCQQSYSGGRFTSVFWVDAMYPNTLDRSFETLSDTLSNSTRSFADADSRISFVKTKISCMTQRWLFVFDNFDQPSAFRDVREYFPHSGNGAILFTSRHMESGRLGLTIPVGSMTEDDGLELLFQRTGQDRSDENNKFGRHIVQKLGSLALAIDQAAAYISARGLQLSDYLEHFAHRREIVLRHTPQIWEYKRKVGEIGQEVPTSALTTWELSFELLGDHNNREKIGHLLTLSAFFDNANITEDLFRSYFSTSQPTPEWMDIFTNTSGEWDHFRFQDVVGELLRLSLVQSVEHERENYAKEGTSVLMNFIASQRIDNLPLRKRREILSHMDAIVQNQKDLLLSEDEVYSLENSAECFASFYESQGRYKEAEELYQLALKCKKRHKKIHPNVLRTTVGLGIVYSRQGRLEEAEKQFQWVLEELENQPEGNHSDTVWTVANLAIVYRSQGRYSEAEILFNRALRSCEKTLGPDHPDTLRLLMNLAQVCFRQGLYDKAEELGKRVFEDNEKQLGSDHTDTLRAAHELANIYQYQGRYKEAEDLYRRALDGFQGLGTSLKSQGRYSEAEHMYELALKGNEKWLGPDHFETLRTVRGLANVYRRQGRYREAGDLYKLALAGNEKSLGPDHPYTLRTMQGLADVYQHEGRYVDSLHLCELALERNKRKMGPHHPETLKMNFRLGNIYNSQSRYGEAERFLRQALEGQEKQIGQDHPHFPSSTFSTSGVQQMVLALRSRSLSWYRLGCR